MWQVPGLSEGEGTVELPYVKSWKEWEQKKEPNRRMEREQAKLCKMMYDDEESKLSQKYNVVQSMGTGSKKSGTNCY